jgi:hypothetical protein
MYLNETYSRVHIGKNLSDNIIVQNGIKQGDALSPLVFNFALEYHISFWPILMMLIFWEKT